MKNEYKIGVFVMTLYGFCLGVTTEGALNEWIDISIAVPCTLILIILAIILAISIFWTKLDKYFP